MVVVARPETYLLRPNISTQLIPNLEAKSCYRQQQPMCAGPVRLALCVPPLNISMTRFTLTPRENEVAVLICRELTYQQIAYRLGIRPGTVKHHAASIRLKLQVCTNIGLAVAYTMLCQPTGNCTDDSSGVRLS